MAKYCETKDNLIIVRLKGDLDHHIAREIKDEIDGLIILKRITLKVTTLFSLNKTVLTTILKTTKIIFTTGLERAV